MSAEDEAGFTLVESIVALAILVLTFGALYQAFSQGAGGYRRAELALAASELAQSLLDEAGTTEPLAAGTRQGTSPEGYGWQVLTIPYEPRRRPGDGAGPAAYWVTVTVGWQARAAGAPSSFTMATLRLQEAPTR